MVHFMYRTMYQKQGNYLQVLMIRNYSMNYFYFAWRTVANTRKILFMRIILVALDSLLPSNYFFPWNILVQVCFAVHFTLFTSNHSRIFMAFVSFYDFYDLYLISWKTIKSFIIRPNPLGSHICLSQNIGLCWGNKQLQISVVSNNPNLFLIQ